MYRAFCDLCGNPAMRDPHDLPRAQFPVPRELTEEGKAEWILSVTPRVGHLVAGNKSPHGSADICPACLLLCLESMSQDVRATIEEGWLGDQFNQPNEVAEPVLPRDASLLQKAIERQKKEEADDA